MRTRRPSSVCHSQFPKGVRAALRLIPWLRTQISELTLTDWHRRRRLRHRSTGGKQRRHRHYALVTCRCDTRNICPSELTPEILVVVPVDSSHDTSGKCSKVCGTTQAEETGWIHRTASTSLVWRPQQVQRSLVAEAEAAAAAVSLDGPNPHGKGCEKGLWMTVFNSSPLGFSIDLLFWSRLLRPSCLLFLFVCFLPPCPDTLGFLYHWRQGRRQSRRWRPGDTGESFV